MVNLKIYWIIQVSRRNARRVVGSGLKLHITEVFTNISKIKSKAEEKTIFDHVRQLIFKNSCLATSYFFQEATAWAGGWGGFRLKFFVQTLDCHIHDYLISQLGHET